MICKVTVTLREDDCHLIGFARTAWFGVARKLPAMTIIKNAHIPRWNKNFAFISSSVKQNFEGHDPTRLPFAGITQEKHTPFIGAGQVPKDPKGFPH